ncbi:TPA: HU family DNA-binding protein [Pseudomonas aeruginosa]
MSAAGKTARTQKQQTVKEATMRKPELAAAIAEKADLTKEQANRVLNALLDEITGALNRKDSVTLVGFGTFLQRHRGAHTGKNPQTGQPVKIKASNTVAFKPGKALRDAVN